MYIKYGGTKNKFAEEIMKKSIIASQLNHVLIDNPRNFNVLTYIFLILDVYIIQWNKKKIAPENYKILHN